MKKAKGTAVPSLASEPETVMIAVPHDRIDFTRWLMEAPIGILRPLVAALETGSLDAPLASADDADWAAYDGMTANELCAAAMRDPEQAAWARANWRQWLARMPRPKRGTD